MTLGEDNSKAYGRLIHVLDLDGCYEDDGDSLEFSTLLYWNAAETIEKLRKECDQARAELAMTTAALNVVVKERNEAIHAAGQIKHEASQ